MPRNVYKKIKYPDFGGSYYKDKNNIWRYEYKECHNGIVTFRKRLRAKTETLLKRKIDKLRQSLLSPNQPAEINISQLIDLWFTNRMEGNIANNTLKFYREKTDIIKKKFGKRNVKSLTMGEIELFLKDLHTFGGSKQQGLAPSSVNYIKKLLTILYEYALQLKVATTNPTIGIKPIKDLRQSTQQDLCVLSEDEVKEILKIAKEGNYIYEGVDDRRELTITPQIEYNKKVAYLLVLLGFSTGMRFSEIRGLRWEDIDFDHNKINLRTQLPRSDKDTLPPKKEWLALNKKAKKTKSQTDSAIADNANPFRKLKTKNSIRHISLDPTVIAELHAFNDYQTTYAKENKSFSNEWGLILTNGAGSPVSAQNFQKRYFQKLLKSAKISRRITLHGMRHTHASLLLRHNVNIATVSRRLGHASPSTTYNIYIHVLPQDADAASGVWEAITTTTEKKVGE